MLIYYFTLCVTSFSAGLFINSYFKGIRKGTDEEVSQQNSAVKSESRIKTILLALLFTFISLYLAKNIFWGNDVITIETIVIDKYKTHSYKGGYRYYISTSNDLELISSGSDYDKVELDSKYEIKYYKNFNKIKSVELIE